MWLGHGKCTRTILRGERPRLQLQAQWAVYFVCKKRRLKETGVSDIFFSNELYSYSHSRMRTGYYSLERPVLLESPKHSFPVPRPLGSPRAVLFNRPAQLQYTCLLYKTQISKFWDVYIPLLSSGLKSCIIVQFYYSPSTGWTLYFYKQLVRGIEPSWPIPTEHSGFRLISTFPAPSCPTPKCRYSVNSAALNKERMWLSFRKVLLYCTESQECWRIVSNNLFDNLSILCPSFFFYNRNPFQNTR
jgi:hypothetical protein